MTLLTKSPDESGTEQKPKTNLLLALIVIASAQLMIVLDASIVNIALPVMKGDLGFTSSGLQWVVTSYALALGSLLLFGGRLGDLFGRRRTFTLGILIFTFASFLGGFAWNPTVMIAARVLQGVGAALASPAALALINTTFPVGPARNRAMAVYGAMSGAGAAVGLMLGGFLTEIHWSYTFFVNVPIGLLVAFLAPRVLVESETKDSKIDWAGTVLASSGLFALVYGLSHAAEKSSWGDLLSWGPIASGLVLLAAFLVVQSKSAYPLLPLRILANQTRLISMLAMLLVSGGMFAMFFFLGLYFQDVLNYSPVMSGLAFLPFSFGIAFAAILGSKLVSQIDPRYLAGTGGLFGALGMWGLTHLTVETSYWTGLFPWIVLLSFGMGLVFIPLTLTATHGVADEDSGAAASALNTMQQIGGAVGLAALSTVFVSGINEKFKDIMSTVSPGKQPPAMETIKDIAQTYGSTQGFWVASGMLLAAAVIILIFLRAKHTELQSSGEGVALH